MERGYEYSDCVATHQVELSKIDDDKLILLALHEILSPIEKIIDSPYTTAILFELEKRATG